MENNFLHINLNRRPSDFTRFVPDLNLFGDNQLKPGDVQSKLFIQIYYQD